ncbi:hypothetical protein MNV49_004337 [Pseudohyphozyma bogoriensis]|nr:hypothetical protein MNV49_004337 [Pseudohyphozyma bogoriensis]
MSASTSQQPPQAGPSFDPLSGYASTSAPGATSATRQATASSSQSQRSARGGPSASTNASTSGASVKGKGSLSGTKRRTGAGSGRDPLAPPRLPDLAETEEQWRAFHEKEKSQGWHHLPLVLVALPPFGAILHGRAENWTDAIILVLLCFILYHIIIGPWEIYEASRTRTIISTAVDQDADDHEDPRVLALRRHAIGALRTSEMAALAAAIAAPAAGALILHAGRGLLHDGDRYLNRSVVTLFICATTIKPIFHIFKLLKRRVLFYQEVVQYPSAEVYFLRRRVASLENEVDAIKTAFATKDDVRMLRDGVDVPLGQLSKAVRRFDKKDAYNRMAAGDRFAIIDAKFDQAANHFNAQLDEIRAEAARNAHPIRALASLIGALIGLGNRGQQAAGGIGPPLRWFEKGPLSVLLMPILWPVNMSNAALEWVSTKSDAPDQGNQPAGSHKGGNRMTT